MKRFFTIVFVLAFAFPILAQNDIPNWSFENWDSSYYYTPKNWDMVMGNITHVQPSHSGNWACKIATDGNQQNPGVLVNGQTNNGLSFTGGKPYSQRPDSIGLYIKYHIAPNDTARIVILFKNSGIPIMAPQIMSLAWGTDTNSFHLVKFKVNLPPLVVPDTVIVGIVAFDYINNNNGPFSPNNFIIVDDINFIGTGITQQIPNNDFEQWDSTQVFTPQGWINGDLLRTAMTGGPLALERTTGSTGNYGILLRNILSNGDTIGGYTMTSSLNSDPWDNKPTFSLTQPFTHNTFSFDYKYLPQNGDSMTIMLSLFNNGNPVGGVHFIQGATVNTWTTVNLQLGYNTLNPPDSAKIHIFAFRADSASRPLGNTLLYIDNLRFSTPSTVESQIDLNNNISIYPNPFNNTTNINCNLTNDEHVAIKIFDVLGNEFSVINDKNMAKGNYNFTFNASGLNKGLYFCEIKTGNTVVTKKLILL